VAIRNAATVLLIAIFAPRILAQDSFEVQVYESDLVPTGHYELDVHNIYVGRGSSTWEGTVAPSDQQYHLAFEFTRGMTDEFELGSYLLFARLPDGSSHYAGFRIRPRVRAPDSWNLPVGISLSMEIGFPQLVYEPNHVSLEFRLIIDKRVGRWMFDINPDVTFAFNGPEAGQGMALEPEAKIGYDIIEGRLMGEVEYFSALGPARDLLPFAEQVHLLYPKLEYTFTQTFVLNGGVGFGLTDASDRLSWALRATFNF